MKRTEFDILNSRERVLWLLESVEKFGGPQSVADIQKNLDIPNANVRSIVIRMMKSGQIERVSKGVYRMAHDNREYVKDKPAMKIE